MLTDAIDAFCMPVTINVTVSVVHL